MEYKVKVKPMVTCPLSEQVVSKVKKEGKIELPFFFGYDGKNTCYVYAEEIMPEKKVGRLEEFNGTKVPGNRQILEEASILSSQQYSMLVTGISGNLLDAVITTNAIQSVKSDGGENPFLSEAWENAYALGGPFTRDYHDTVMQFFDLHGVDDDLRLRIVSGYTLPVDEDGMELTLEKPASMWMPTNTGNEKGLYYTSYAATALEQAMDGNPIIYEGPKSVGKNFLDEWVAYILGGIYYEISVDPDMAKSELYGDRVIDDTSARHLTKRNSEAYLRYMKGDLSSLEEASEHEFWARYSGTMRFIVESTEFKRWLRQRSGRRVLMVNEINYGNPTVLAVVFNRVAEDRPVRFIDVPGEGRIYIGRDCILTASMNRDYVGTTELNEAMRSRFGVIEMQPSSHIKPILKDKIESEFGKGVLPDGYYTACDKLYAYMLARTTSSAEEAQYGDKAISIRSFIRALRTVASKKQRKPKLLCAQLNIQLRGQCDTPMERSSLSDDINEIIGEL